MGPYIILLLVVAVVFGLCYCVDKGFTKLFRGKVQHKSGLSVKPSKRYASIGLIAFALGMAAMFATSSQGVLMLVAGAVITIVGTGLIIYYLTFGVYYDDESFIISHFGKKSQTWRYGDIEGQQLYNSYGNIIIELYLTGGKSVQLQSTMVGVYAFMDKAFYGWLKQTGRKQEDCAFYDPQNSCWFPTPEE